MKYLVIFFLTINSAFGDVKHLDKGEVAPYEGYLFDVTSERQARQAVLDVDYYKGLNESYQKMVQDFKANETIYQERITNFSTQNDNLAKQLESAHSVSNWEKFGYFALGVVITGAISYGVVHTLR